MADKKIPVIVVGPGKSLGWQVCQAISQAPDLELIGVLRRNAPGSGLAEFGGASICGSFNSLVKIPRVQPWVEAGGKLSHEAVVFVSTRADALASVLPQIQEHELQRLVVATTGLSASDMSLIQDIARSGALAVVAPNFLRRVYLLLEMCALAARQLTDERDVVRISEVHHNRKADWPSGTAMKIVEVVAAALGLSQEEVVILGRSSAALTLLEKVIVDATRIGSVYGEHEVVFGGGYDRLILAHKVDDRAGFADAACNTIRWIAGQALPGTGLQTMVDVFDLPYLKALRRSLPSL